MVTFDGIIKERELQSMRRELAYSRDIANNKDVKHPPFGDLERICKLVLEQCDGILHLSAVTNVEKLSECISWGECKVLLPETDPALDCESASF